MAVVRIATLLTDFGTRGPYAAAMKGVLHRVSPGVLIEDLSHDVPAHDVLTGAFVLAHSAPYFPPGTVHVIVIDPGVGTERAILAAHCGGHIFLAPDNGVLTLVAETMGLESIVTVQNVERISGPRTSRTFQGRDVFAPLAGQILNGLDPRRLGPQPGTYKVLDLPKPEPRGREIIGQVVYVDGFGNLVTNIPEALLVRSRWDLQALKVTCGQHELVGVRDTYAAAQPGQPLALTDSMGRLELAVNQGRACDLLQAGVGTQVRVQPAHGGS